MNFFKKWRLLLILACMGIVLAAVLHHFLTRPEPAYGGLTLSAWFHESEIKTYVEDNAAATRAIRSLGAAAVPYLARQMGQQYVAWDDFYWKRYPKLPLRLRSHLPEPHRPGARRFTAAMMLAEIGAPAGPAFPDILAAYNREFRNEYHLSPSSQMDWPAELAKPAKPMLPLGVIPLAQQTLRLWLLRALVQTGGDSRETVPILLAALHDQDQVYRDQAAYFAQSSTNLDVAIRLSEPVVLAGLGDPEPRTRSAAAAMLGALAPDHPEIIPPLIKAAEDPDASVRRNAWASLAKSPADLEMLLPLLVRMLDDPDTGTHGLAMVKLMKAGGGFAKLPGALTEKLASRDPAVRAAAARALGRYGSRSKLAIPKLTELTIEANEPDQHVREEAAGALAKIAPAEVAK